MDGAVDGDLIERSGNGKKVMDTWKSMEYGTVKILIVGPSKSTLLHFLVGYQI